MFAANASTPSRSERRWNERIQQGHEPTAPEKVAVVEEVTTKLNDAQAVIVTEYRGMSVGQLASLRRTLKDVGGEYKVYKNTLAKFAAERAGVESLEGPARRAERHHVRRG